MSYVRFDPENGDLSLTLAAADHRFQGELYRLLTERFLETEFSEATLAAMDRYVEEWLQQRKDRPRP